MARIATLVLLLPLCVGCPQMLVARGAATAAHIIADDRSLGQQTADLDLKSQIDEGLLDASPALAADVNVDVFLGRVMLTGVVGDGSARTQATRIAQGIADARAVYDDIEIASGSVSDAIDDAATNKALGLNLVADEGLASQSLLHRVVDGRAFIMGEVDDGRRIDTIRAVALQTPGVDRVVTHVVVER